MKKNLALILSFMEIILSTGFALAGESCGRNCEYTIETQSDQRNLYIKGTSSNAQVGQPFVFENNGPAYRNYGENCILKGQENCTFLSSTDSQYNNVTLDGIDRGYTSSGRAGMQCIHINGNLTISNTNSHTIKTIATQSVIEGDIIFDNSVSEIGYRSFWETYIGGDVIIPDTVQKLSDGAFRASHISGNLVLPDTITIERDVFLYATVYGNGGIYCKGDVNLCRAKLLNAGAPDNLISNLHSYDEYIALKTPTHIVRRIYTVEEATAAVKGNKNTFSIRYR